MNKKLLGIKKSFKSICLVLSISITLQQTGSPIKALNENESISTEKFLQQVNIDDANVNENTRWSKLVKDAYEKDYKDATENEKTFKNKIDEIKDNYLDGYNKDNPLIINNALELAAFAAVVNGVATSDDNTKVGPYDFLNKHVLMKENIDLKGSGLTYKENENTAKTVGMKHAKLTLSEAEDESESIGLKDYELVQSEGEDTKEYSKSIITYSGIVENAWSPIGISDNTSFKGTFDGGNHEIKNMIVVEKPGMGSAYAGLFGHINGATIKNIGIGEGSHVISSSYAGGLVGCANHGVTTISNIYFMGTVFSSYAGGLVGRNNSITTITDSYVEGSVASSCYAYAGGLIGYSCETAKIIDSYVIGTIFSSYAYGSSCAGGLIGCNNGDTIITNSHVTAMVSSFSSFAYAGAGGLLGGNNGNITVTNSYAVGLVSSLSSSYSYTGGLIGYICGTAEIIDSYSEEVIFAGSYLKPYVGILIGSKATKSIASINYSYCNEDSNNLSSVTSEHKNPDSTNKSLNDNGNF